jgi:hypothetical protein
MKKILEKVQNVFKHDQALEQEQTINSLMNLIFKEQNTHTSIKLFEKFKIRFEQEIANRGIESLIEHTTCEEYFDRVKTVNHLCNSK